MVKKRAKQDVNKETPIYSDPVYKPPKPGNIPIAEIPRNLLDIKPEINIYFPRKTHHSKRV